MILKQDTSNPVDVAEQYGKNSTLDKSRPGKKSTLNYSLFE